MYIATFYATPGWRNLELAAPIAQILQEDCSYEGLTAREAHRWWLSVDGLIHEHEYVLKSEESFCSL